MPAHITLWKPTQTGGRFYRYNGLVFVGVHAIEINFSACLLLEILSI